MGYLVCGWKRSRPVVSPALCEHCSRRYRCGDYRNYTRPPLFEKTSIPAITGRRRQKPGGKNLEAGSSSLTPAGPMQLVFDFGGKD